MDKDSSGVISMDEFEESCRLLNDHTKSEIPEKSIKDLARSIDMDKNGYIDFNEFLEAFRLVNKKVENGRRSSLDLSPSSKRKSPSRTIHIIT